MNRRIVAGALCVASIASAVSASAAAPTLTLPGESSAPADRLGYDPDGPPGAISLTGSDGFTQLYVICTPVQSGPTYELRVNVSAFINVIGPHSPEESFISFRITGATGFDSVIDEASEIIEVQGLELAGLELVSPSRAGSAPTEFRARIDVDKWVIISDDLGAFDVGDNYQVSVPCS